MAGGWEKENALRWQAISRRLLLAGAATACEWRAASASGTRAASSPTAARKLRRAATAGSGGGGGGGGTGRSCSR
jgi:hypothetical protein